MTCSRLGATYSSGPQRSPLDVSEALLRGRFDYDVTGLMDATHLRWYTLDSLTRLLTACGFVVESRAGALGGQHPAYSTRLPWIALPERYRLGVLRRLVRFFRRRSRSSTSSARAWPTGRSLQRSGDAPHDARSGSDH